MWAASIFDNDSGQFSLPHPDALNSQKCEEIVRAIETVIVEITQRRKKEKDRDSARLSGNNILPPH